MKTDHFTSRTADFQKSGRWGAVFTATFMLGLCMNISWSRAAEPSQPSPTALPRFPDWQCLYMGDFGKACIYRITSDKQGAGARVFLTLVDVSDEWQRVPS